MLNELTVLLHPFPVGGHPPVSVFYVLISAFFTIPPTIIWLVLSWNRFVPILSFDGLQRLAHSKTVILLMTSIAIVLLYLIFGDIYLPDSLMFPVVIALCLYYPALIFLIVIVADIIIEIPFKFFPWSSNSLARGLTPSMSGVLAIIIALALLLAG